MKKTVSENYCVYVTELNEKGQPVETRHKMSALFGLQDARNMAEIYAKDPAVIAVRIEKRVKIIETHKELVEIVKGE